MSTVWEDTDGCSKQYRCYLAAYLTDLLSYLYGIIMDFEIDYPGHKNNVVDWFNAACERYLKEQM